MVFMPLQGLNQGAQPVIGYNYGAKKYGRVKQAYKTAVISSTIFVSISFIFLQLFPGFFIAIFSNEPGELMDLGIRVLRICTLFMPALGFQIISSNFFQAIGKPLQGTILSLSRQILLFIPLLLILPRIFGIIGVFSAMPAADIGSTILSAVIIFREMKRIKRLETIQA
jgi:Na+-driven multidrug efflux pump